ncbi:MAG TPA: LysR family transcriptional regulator [Amaricoccus sp.]|nr:LysR family transcriptional regulator [Amaricoccus sp.]
MPRNLDIAALRSFLTVAEIGGVTRAAAQLNLTQSAVSMQLKRLEESFGQSLLDRSGRTIGLTAQGEQLVDHARRLLAANDETWSRMTEASPVGEINLGSPDDLLNPHVPRVMAGFARSHPQLKVRLQTAQSTPLKERFARGELDVILTTEAEPGPGGETIATDPLVWFGAPRGEAWRRRPLPIGTVAGCIFNRPAIETLNAAGFDWKLEIDSVSNPAMDASIAADIVIRLAMRGTVPAQFEVIDHRGALPTLPEFCVNMYVTQGQRRQLVAPLAERLRAAYGEPEAIAAE